MGRIVWRTPIHSNIAAWHGEPALVGNLAYFDINNSIVAVDTRRGGIVWTTVVRPQMFPLSRNIVASGGALFAAGEREIISLDAASGAIRWKLEPDTLIFARSAVDERALYIGTKEPAVLALALGTGATLWKSTIEREWEFGGVVVGVAAARDTLYVTALRRLSYSGHRESIVVLALDRLTGQEIWRYETPNTEARNTFDAPTVTDKLLLISDVMGRTFFAVNRATGELEWTTRAGGYYSGPSARPLVAGNVVYVGSADTYVYAAQLETGKVLWEKTTEGSIYHIALCGDKVFAGLFAVAVLNRHSGKLYGLHVNDPDDFVTSGFVVKDRKVIAVGTEAIYAFSC